MRTRERTLRPCLALTAAGLLLSLAACSGETTGQPHAQTNAPTSGVEAAPPSTNEAGDALSLSIAPCSLLSTDDLAELGTFEDGKRVKTPDSRTCRWQLPPTMENNYEGIVVDLDVRDQQSVESMNPAGGGEVTTAEVNARPTAVAPDPSGTNCTIGMKVDDSSRIDVGIVGPDGLTCDIASTIAYLVEPRLPELPS